MLTVKEFRSQFGKSQCGAQLTRQRWPDGFRCPRCGGPSRGYIASRRVHECARCGYQCSVTAGTIFHKTRTPLPSWFWAIYRMSHDKKGISAAMDFIVDGLASGRIVRILSVVDAFTRECLILEADTSLGSGRVTRLLDRLIEERRNPG